VRKLRLKDVFAFGRILSQAGVASLLTSGKTKKELGAALIERALSLPPDAEKNLYALISDVASVENAEELAIEDFIKLIKELVEYNGGINDFLSRVLSIKRN
jgi:hypothetical protein